MGEKGEYLEADSPVEKQDFAGSQSLPEFIFCTQCGVQNAYNNYRCDQCQAIIQRGAARPVTEAIEDSAGMRMLLPVGRSALAIVAGYFGLFSILIFPAPLALILGILAVWDIKKHPGKHGMGRAVFAIIMGIIFTSLLLIFVIGSLLNI